VIVELVVSVAAKFISSHLVVILDEAGRGEGGTYAGDLLGEIGLTLEVGGCARPNHALTGKVTTQGGLGLRV
jgi:hypothetical protein